MVNSVATTAVQAADIAGSRSQLLDGVTQAYAQVDAGIFPEHPRGRAARTVLP